MRVALLSHNARIGDAVGQQVAARAAFFRERGAEVCTFIESIRCVHPALPPAIRLVLAETTPEELAAELAEYDLLCVEYSQYYRLLDALPLLTGKRPHILLDYHGVTPPELWTGSRELLRESQQRRGLVWFADEVVVHSQFMRRELRAATNYPDERIFDQPLALEPGEPRGLSPRSFPVPSGAKTLLFVGRLAPNKRVPVLIEAVARLRDQHPEVHALIVGDHGDIYQAELLRCRELADRLGVGERIHFLGRLSAADLAAAYRSAEAFVMPSRHEGFCMPVIEAMTHGVPVIAARAGALPETVGDAGLCFTPDDSMDLARQIERVLRDEPQQHATGQPIDTNSNWVARLESSKGVPPRIAVVAARYGDTALGGAERSLRLLAESLAAAGKNVEVFTTGPRAMVEDIAGVRVQRFPAETIDETKLLMATDALSRRGPVAEKIVLDFLNATRASSRLLDALEQREFDAIIAGPFAGGLTWEIARRFPEQMLLLPCFHDEPLARQSLMRDVYARVAGILYHSSEEQMLAQLELGVSHPNSTVIGTWLAPAVGDPQRGRKLAGNSPYLLYCGRYCREKNLPTLLNWLRRYETEFPSRFRFVFVGQGNIAIPEPMIDLGFLSEADKNNVMAGAAALLQPSVHESLSLVALEAWSQGVPVLAHAGSAAVMGHLQRCGGGRGAASYDDFRAALSDLHARPEAWQQLGRQGRDYVQAHYSSREQLVQRVQATLAAMQIPLAEQMRRRGHERAAQFTLQTWAERFGERVESVLDRETSPLKVGFEITGPGDKPQLLARQGQRRIVLQLTNSGSVPLMPDGPTALRVVTRVLGAAGQTSGSAVTTRLPGLVVPGQKLRLPVAIRLPKPLGEYAVEIRLARANGSGLPAVTLPLVVEAESAAEVDPGNRDALHAALADAEPLAELPDGYTDVTEGSLAGVKRTIKQKLLHQFQTAYVDVLSRQQTAFNRSVLAALNEMAECTAMLERGLGAPRPAPSPADLRKTTRRLKRGVTLAVERIEQLEQRLARLEGRLNDLADASPKGGRA